MNTCELHLLPYTHLIKAVKPTGGITYFCSKCLSYLKGEQTANIVSIENFAMNSSTDIRNVLAEIKSLQNTLINLNETNNSNITSIQSIMHNILGPMQQCKEDIDSLLKLIDLPLITASKITLDIDNSLNLKDYLSACNESDSINILSSSLGIYSDDYRQLFNNYKSKIESINIPEALNSIRNILASTATQHTRKRYKIEKIEIPLIKSQTKKIESSFHVEEEVKDNYNLADYKSKHCIDKGNKLYISNIEEVDVLDNESCTNSIINLMETKHYKKIKIMNVCPKALCKILAQIKYPKSHSLKICNNHINMVDVMDAIQFSPLECIVFDNCTFNSGYDDRVSVFSIIRYNILHIHSVGFKSCKLNDSCITELCNSLVANHYLTKLDLSDNLITKTGYEEIKKSSQNFNVLEELVMHGNPCCSNQ